MRIFITKACVKLVDRVIGLINCFTHKAKFNKNCEDVIQIEKVNNHIFRGYYDIDYFSKDNKKIILHMLPREKENGNEIKIAYYDLNSSQLVEICESRCWCWQQGTRLRWYDDKCIIFNDCRDGKYISRIVDVYSGITRREFPFPFYDISTEKKYGISINFSRLQRLRPGYGYKTLEDYTIGMLQPDDDGIIMYDFDKKKHTLIISLKELYFISKCDLKGEGYINHVSISPRGDQFIFFYIVYDENKKKNKTYLMKYSFNDKKISILESEYTLSHYTWENNDSILTTSYFNGKQQYVRYMSNGDKCIYGECVLDKDGHPSFIDEKNIITDTYPLRKQLGRQKILLYSDDTKQTRVMGSLYANRRYIGERRCDLHPSVSQEYISVDSNCGKYRSVFVIKRKDLHDGK